jgi:hypothetical protein
MWFIPEQNKIFITLISSEEEIKWQYNWTPFLNSCQWTYLCSDGDRKIGQSLIIERLSEKQGSFQTVHEHEVILHRTYFKCDTRKDMFKYNVRPP